LDEEKFYINFTKKLEKDFMANSLLKKPHAVNQNMCKIRQNQTAEIM
jgi:hypothetical protein